MRILVIMAKLACGLIFSTIVGMAIWAGLSTNPGLMLFLVIFCVTGAVVASELIPRR